MQVRPSSPRTASQSDAERAKRRPLRQSLAPFLLRCLSSSRTSARDRQPRRSCGAQACPRCPSQEAAGKTPTAHTEPRRCALPKLRSTVPLGLPLQLSTSKPGHHHQKLRFPRLARPPKSVRRPAMICRQPPPAGSCPRPRLPRRGPSVAPASRQLPPGRVAQRYGGPDVRSRGLRAECRPHEWLPCPHQKRSRMRACPHLPTGARTRS
mmetsp:Transcript_17879/g.67437  ORF Transcript_17879/g.67437 Transcript_17879/m.67437 type:complete len:209 (-) Transcript_17879:247-873(-)